MSAKGASHLATLVANKAPMTHQGLREERTRADPPEQRVMKHEYLSSRMMAVKRTTDVSLTCILV